MKLQILFFAFTIFEFTNASVQNITVKGIAVCNKKRLAKANVVLIEKDRFDPNDELAHIETNSEGEFELFGKDNEIFTIEPIIRITHACNTEPNCLRTSEYKVPQNLIGSIYNMTYVVLDVFVHNDKTKCK
ncbi:unnamed protein product [Caenorhabditis angaria]|uniref:Uncharacterized protein n=1 Tax=Caenorhabditis angaria TaxID=860376 RepID=A0A9P1IRN9_9PELO|nr:unnamed protein product [Caenorhabditis angaria]